MAQGSAGGGIAIRCAHSGTSARAYGLALSWGFNLRVAFCGGGSGKNRGGRTQHSLGREVVLDLSYGVQPLTSIPPWTDLWQGRSPVGPHLGAKGEGTSDLPSFFRSLMHVFTFMDKLFLYIWAPHGTTTRFESNIQHDWQLMGLLLLTRVVVGGPWGWTTPFA